MGRVKYQVMKTSMMVDESEEEGEAPHVAHRDQVDKTAASRLTVSAASTVRHAKRNPRSTDVRIERPARASSLNRSKYTM